MNTRLKALLFILPLMLALLFVQEIAKLNINFYLDTAGNYPSFFDQTPEVRKQQLDAYRERWPAFNQYAHHPRIDFLHQLSLPQLKAAKWVLAGALVALHFVLNLLFLRWFAQQRTARILIVVTGAAIGISGLFFVINQVSGNGTAAYNIARELLGFAQGPLPAALIAFGLFVHRRFSAPNAA
jgi:hypothetical protein